MFDWVFHVLQTIQTGYRHLIFPLSRIMIMFSIMSAEQMRLKMLERLKIKLITHSFHTTIIMKFGIQEVPNQQIFTTIATFQTAQNLKLLFFKIMV